MKELSICMTHINRKEQLFNTLYSIEKQNVRDLIEIIIVDDVSNVPLSIEDFDNFNLDIKLVTVSTKNKWWVNPVVAFNTAFNFINGKRTIIQNSECMHVTDVINFVIENLKEKDYIAMSALALSKESTLKINKDTIVNDIDTHNSQWYCHSTHRPEPLNFCAAIFTEDLKRVGGFDDRFAEGMWFDDNAFIVRLHNNNISTRIEDMQLVYHQWHDELWVSSPKFNELKRKNEILYLSIKNG